MAARKKTVRARSRQTASKKNADVNLQEVLQKVVNAIGVRAEELAEAVVDDAVKKAQVQPMKILFEMIGLFSEGPGEHMAGREDQSLAKELLEQLGLAEEAVLSEGEAGERCSCEVWQPILMPVPVDPVK